MFSSFLVMAAVLAAPVHHEAVVSLQASIAQRLTAADYEKLSKQINDYRIQASKPGPGGKIPSREAVYALLATYAQSLLGGVDISRIPAEDAQKWASLFTTARMTEEANRLAKTAISYHAVQLMFVQADLVSNLMSAGKVDEAVAVVDSVVNRDGSQLGMIGESLMGGARRGGVDKSHPEVLAACFEKLASRIERDAASQKRKGNEMADYAYVDLRMKALEVRYAAHPDPAILQQMQDLKAQFATSKSVNAFGNGPAYRVDEFLIKTLSIGQAAPEVTADQSLGQFSSLAALRGKVVLLDFMAHWCGPCKAAFPGIRELYAANKGKGFQVISVTSFYGYYGAKQGVTQSAELDLMKAFVKQFDLAWPVVFDTKQATHARYHVGAIPHMVVIDKVGKVRMVQVGNTKEGEAEVKALVEKLVKE